ncbi:hypothetical protein K7472_31130 [Streptomyces sp. PTM05]|uniref:Glycoside hydrolase family 57 N-terminal domain-containing protein n=1 Tax=Streptantibioticus parmotrematis TaxID=2873249 RepID=A0ABS7R235_9ACTN|nr:hypothetical protein [Streptantibioticus parmotrematis]MBY8889263.1 hypothetical protein [Streptantibioticus parmotrematis]
MNREDKQAMAFVHHANQLVIGDGYADRDGISEICRGYERVLTLHHDHGVPAALHLSGTLIEALAWHRPEFLHRVRQAVAEGCLTLLGGPYSEPIMPLLAAESNRRQLITMADLLERHLGVPEGAVPTAWLPERVWHPSLMRVLTDPGLPGGGYRRALVDDRLFHDDVGGGARSAAENPGPYEWHNALPSSVAGLVDPALTVARTVPGPRPLELIPINSFLRYLIPARTPDHLRLLDEFVEDLRGRAADPGASLLVYADDLERTAGVAGWEAALDSYERVVRWAASPAGPVHPVHLDTWLDKHPPPVNPVPSAGSYHELAVAWSAGETYQGWAGSPEWQPYQRLIDDTGALVTAARDRPADSRLLDLAERLVMVGMHETAWRDASPEGRHLAPWVKAVASHSRLARPLVAAARWSAAQAPSMPCAALVDVDGDGDEELLLAGQTVWALVSPGEGGRVCLLAHRPASHPGDQSGNKAALIVGNPIDHWNFQEELHRFMDVPPGHPGALTEPTFRHLAWAPRQPKRHAHAVTVDLHPRSDTPQAGTRRYAVLDGVPALAACLRAGSASRPLDVESALVPDYLRALLNGRAGLRRTGGHGWAGWSLGDRTCWVGYDPLQACSIPPRWTAAGHSCPFALRSCTGHLDVLIGAGPVTDSHLASWLDTSRAVLHAR